ncbi:hypothetical protein KX816_08265 [Sphingosinicellaceae bacterium]|nr:hypothetical protein KX816_08265 [Sphingosinicellaceae bacterium]
MSDMADSTLHDPLGQRDFGRDGVSESSFGQDPGAGGTGSRYSSGASSFREQTMNLRSQATDKLRSVADEGKQQVTNSLDGLVDAAREIAHRIGDKGGPLGAYAITAADTLEHWASTVKDKSVEDLMDDGREFIRQQPGMAVGIAVAAGFVLTRLLKVSGGRYSA